VVLLERHVSAMEALADAARANAVAQVEAARELRLALDNRDVAAAHSAIDKMWFAYRRMYASLQASERAWNDLAPAAAGDPG
jgi:cell wall assembly regulator SMI1